MQNIWKVVTDRIKKKQSGDVDEKPAISSTAPAPAPSTTSSSTTSTATSTSTTSMSTSTTSAAGTIVWMKYKTQCSIRTDNRWRMMICTDSTGLHVTSSTKCLFVLNGSHMVLSPTRMTCLNASSEIDVNAMYLSLCLLNLLYPILVQEIDQEIRACMVQAEL